MRRTITLVRFSSLQCNVSDYTPTDFTGAQTEKGMGDGVNFNINYPLPRGIQDSNYCAALSKAIENIREFDPAYLLLRCLSIPLTPWRNTDSTFC
jgi:acetoin utilization deacetylase AcuC-like enzyme